MDDCHTILNYHYILQKRIKSNWFMGNKYHKINVDDQSNLFLLSKTTISYNQLILPIYASNISSTPIRKASTDQKPKKIEQQNLKIQNKSQSSHHDHQKQLKDLRSIVKAVAKVPQFKVASNEEIARYKNKLIKDTEKQPLPLDESILKQPYQQKQEPYIIKIQNLPSPGNNLPNAWIYIGRWYQGYPHGIGKLYHNTFNYYGYFNKGIPHLKGRITLTDQIYEGQLIMNVKQGFGRFIMKKGYYYQGQWKNNLRQGEGYQIHKNGSVFEGSYRNDKVHKGQYYIPKAELKKKLNSINNNTYLSQIRYHYKEKYSGTFNENKFEGYGDYIWSDGRTYQGYWKEGKMHGKGVFTWPNGKRYQGEYVSNQKDGYGKFYCNPKIYECYWQKGKLHAKVTITKGDRVFSTIFNQGKMVKSMDEQYDQIQEQWKLSQLSSPIKASSQSQN